MWPGFRAQQPFCLNCFHQLPDVVAVPGFERLLGDLCVSQYQRRFQELLGSLLAWKEDCARSASVEGSRSVFQILRSPDEELIGQAVRDPGDNAYPQAPQQQCLSIEAAKLSLEFVSRLSRKGIP